MQEIIEEQKPKQFDLQYLVDVVRRRHMQFLVPMFAGWLLVWGASWIIPARYKSGTLILVQQPTMPKDYVVPNISDNLQDRLQSITQQILSRTRLLTIINQLDLYSGGRRKMTPDEKVAEMRKQIDIDLVRDPHEDQITAFNIYYSAHDPLVAQRVTGELSKLFINANLEVRQQESEDTTKFLETQLNDARTSLATQEEQIREFKGSHIGDLPTQQASNLQILSGLQTQLASEQDALNAAEQQKVYLQTVVNQYKTAQGTIKMADPASARIAAIDQDIDKMRAQLADLSTRYTDNYPDIKSLKAEIASSEQSRNALIAQSKTRPAAGSPASDPALTAQNLPVLQLQGQLSSNLADIKSRKDAIANLEAKINDYQARLNQEPMTEQQMADLTRGYDQSKASYDDLLKKKNESQMATSMELLQQGERFAILDPPSMPLKPDFPNRLKFCGIGIGFGLALGLLVAGGLEFMDDRLHSNKVIKDMLPVPVIVEIPEIFAPADVERKRRQVVIGWSVAAVIVIVIAAGSAFNYLHS